MKKIFGALIVAAALTAAGAVSMPAEAASATAAKNVQTTETMPTDVSARRYYRRYGYRRAYRPYGYYGGYRPYRPYGYGGGYGYGYRRPGIYLGF